MPYEVGSDNLPSNVKSLSDKKQRQWIHVFNTSLGNGDSEATAFAKANGVANKTWVDSYEVAERMMSQDQANYTPMGMSGGNGCASCRWFVSPDACIVVDGDISPTGLSDLYLAIQAPIIDPIPVTIIKSIDNGRSVKEKVTSWISKLRGMNVGAAVQAPNFTLKEVGDETRFYLRVSNNFTDRENQTLTLAAHKEYVEWADAEKAYPELWVWHASGTRLGQADLLDVSNGVLVASGLIDPGMKSVAESIVASGELDGVSHGFLHKTIGNDVVRYRSYELSLVPRKYAANFVGGGTLLTKELEMAFTPEKKALLAKYFGEERVKEFEDDTERLKTEFEGLGIQSKEIDEAVTLAEQLGALTKAMAEGFTALAASNKMIMDQMSGVNGAMATMKGEVAEAKKTLDERVEETLTPVVAGAQAGFSASRSDSTVVDAKGEKELAAAAKDTDWFSTMVMPNIMKGL